MISVVLEQLLLTGWSWSRSGSNLVTRWWHLSKSTIFFGNQWTVNEKRMWLFISVFLLAFEMHFGCNKTQPNSFFLTKQRNGLTLHFFGCFDILCVPLDRADQSVDVRQVHLTADEVLQTLQVVLGFPAWPRLQMMDLCFKGLGKYNRHHELGVSSSSRSVWRTRRDARGRLVFYMYTGANVFDSEKGGL